MSLSIILSDETFWDWVKNKVIEGNLNYFDKMIDVERYTAGKQFRCDSESNSSIFHKLKDAMPSDYFLEVEYCALAYSVVFGKVFPPLSTHIKQLAYIEWLSYVEPEEPKYRDHFVHMLKVAFVSDHIFDKVLSEDIVKWEFDSSQEEPTHFRKWCDEEKVYFNEDKKKNIARAAIFLAAIFHDFGYGYKFMRKYEEKLFNLNLLGCDSVEITRSRAEIIKRSLMARFVVEHHEWYENRKLELPQKENIVLGFFRDCLPLNHSVASALAVLDIAEELYLSHVITPDLYVAFQIAAEACCFHDMTKLKQYLHLKNSGNSDHFLDSKIHEKIPVAALLILSDELSIWNRPRIEYESKINGYEKVTRLHHRWKNDQNYPECIKLEFEQKELNISLDNVEQNKNFTKELLKLSVFRDIAKKDALSMFDYEIKFN